MMIEKRDDDVEKLISLAGDVSFKDYGRAEDGTLSDWHKWAAVHPQKNEEIHVCHGREVWRKANTNNSKATSENNDYKNDEKKRKISIVSWNILSDTWYETGRSGYTHTPIEHGSWNGRFPLILEWIERLYPDVLALQEVDFDKFDIDILPKLESMGYSGVMQSSKKHRASQPCGVATFWRSDHLKLVQDQSFSRSMVVVLQFLDDQTDHTPSTAATTTTTTTAETVALVNVHLESSQSEAGTEKRARQLNSPLAWASRSIPSDTPLVMCGDYNTGADAGLFHVLRNFHWHGDWASVYEHPSTSQALAVCRGSFVVPNHHYSIDHIVYSHEQVRLRAVLNALTEEEIADHLGYGKDKGFPSAFCPSDHIPIGAVFDIVAKQPTSQPEEESVGAQRQDEIRADWQRLKDCKPPQRKGKPTPEEIEVRRAYSTKVKEWKKTFEGNPAELQFANDLIKGISK